MVTENTAEDFDNLINAFKLEHNIDDGEIQTLMISWIDYRYGKEGELDRRVTMLVQNLTKKDDIESMKDWKRIIKATKCPYCDATFKDAPSIEEAEHRRKEHIKEKHPKRISVGNYYV